MIETISSLSTIVKAKLLQYSLIIFLWFSPIHLTIATVLLAILIDTIAGRWAAREIAKKEGKDVRLVVTSRKTRIGFLDKGIRYFVLLFLTFFADKIIFHDLLLFFVPTFPIAFFTTKALGIIFVLFEFDSFDEKYYKVKGVRIKELIKKKIKESLNFFLNIKRDLKDE